MLVLIPVKNQNLSVSGSQVQQVRDNLAEQISKERKGTLELASQANLAASSGYHN